MLYCSLVIYGDPPELPGLARAVSRGSPKFPGQAREILKVIITTKKQHLPKDFPWPFFLCLKKILPPPHILGGGG